MRLTNVIICLGFLIAGTGIAHSQENDSVAVDSLRHYDLHEVVVQGERAWFEGDKLVVIPTKKEKNLSNSPASLVSAMNIPGIQEKNGTLSTITGEQISIYINGEKADRIDQNTFWPKLAKRVEYIRDSTDPTFEGSPEVINIIMTEYKVGGVTRIDLTQCAPSRGYYIPASKLVYKRMSYGLGAFASYARDHRPQAHSTETFRKVNYNGDFFDEITHTYNRHSWERSEFIDIAFNAKYSGDRFRASHNIVLGMERNPGSGSNAEDIWSPDLFGATASQSYLSGRSLSPQISGNYSSNLSDKWAVSGNWLYAYTHSNSTSWNQTGDLAPIPNAVKETTNTLRVSAYASFQPNNRLSFMFDMRRTYGSRRATPVLPIHSYGNDARTWAPPWISHG